MKRKIILAILFIAIGSSVVFAQKNKEEATIGNRLINIMKQKKALIVLLQDKAENQNEILRRVVPENWPYHTQIEFKTMDEMVTLEKAKNKDYAVLYLYYEFPQSGVTDLHNEVVNNPSYYNCENKEYNSALDFTASDRYRSASLVLANIEDFDALRQGTDNPIVQISMHFIKLVDFDLIAGMDFIKSFIEEATEHPTYKYSTFYTKNVSELKDLTLAIPEKYISKYPSTKRYIYVTPESISSNYPYKFELVSDTTFANIITERRKGYAYFYISKEAPEIPSIYFPFIMNAETGKCLLVAKPIENKYYGLNYLIEGHFLSIASYFEK